MTAMSRDPRLRGSALAIALALMAGLAAAEDYTILHAFSAQQGHPQAALVAASDGKFYGTSVSGGVDGIGSIFALEPDGIGGYTYSEVYAASLDSEGTSFSNALVEGLDGLLYGTAQSGGSFGYGAVFRVSPGGVYEALASFDNSNGAYPNGLILASDGAFYGTTTFGGATGYGTVFRFDSGGITVLHAFNGNDGGQSATALLEASNGDFYGTTASGGLTGTGTVFRMTASGTLTTVFSFGGADGAGPYGALIEDGDGNLYGTTQGGGASGFGTIFRVDPSDDVSTLHDFSPSGPEGAGPHAGLFQGSDDNLYGTTPIGGGFGNGAVYRLELSGPVVSAVHFFSASEGANSFAPLIEASPGHLLGTTVLKGSGSYGTVFDCDFSGSLLVVHAFFGAPEGISPGAGVVEAPDGSFYGTARYGGLGGLGTVFRLDTFGAATLLHAFQGYDGGTPLAALTFGGDGRLYGTTYFGDGVTRGSAFAIDTLGNFQLLHAFNGTDGERLHAGLLAATDGDLYGVLSNGGAFRLSTSGTFTPLGAGYGGEGTLIESKGSFYGTTAQGGNFTAGTVFRMDGSGAETVLYEFGGPPEGFYPAAGLLKASDGFFYGTTKYGGAGGNGIVFRMAADGATSTIHTFQFPDGGYPSASLIEASDGFLYGTTEQGGFGNNGTVFRVDFSGTGFSTVHAFSATDGVGSDGSLIQVADGSLVGTGIWGGAHRGGIVFRLGLPPSPLTVSGVAPSSGPASGGTAVSIAGAGFVSGASVAIGGAPASGPSVIGPTQLLAATPAMSPGALHDVTVTNPDTTVSSLTAGFLADFLDVPEGDGFHQAVESVFRSGITAGCGAGNYCRDTAVTRAQMAVFLVKAAAGPLYEPSPATGTVFLDVPAAAFAADWIEDLAARGVTAGCGGGNYCPDQTVTRAQMAVFLLKARLSPFYEPAPPTGTLFEDVPIEAFAAAWIEDLAGRGITGGCSASPPLFCPSSANTRGQMAVFLRLTFLLP